MNKNFLLLITATFILLTAAFYSLMPGFDKVALHTGNVAMALLSFVSYTIVSKQLTARPQAFVRAVSGSSYLKIFVCIIGLLTYIMIKRPDVHKPTVFALMGIYAVYTVVETIFVQKLARKTK